MSESSGVTVRELLPTSFSGLEERVQDVLAKDASSTDPSLPGFARHVAASEATTALQGVLDCDFFSLLARGWGLATELKAHTDRKRYPAGTTSIVYLGEHSVVTQIHPVLTLVIGAIECRPLRFTVDLKAHFRSVALVILDGYIIALNNGDCSVSAQLKYGEVALHKEVASRNVNLPGHVPLQPPGVAIGGDPTADSAVTPP